MTVSNIITTNINTRNYIFDTNCPIVPTGNSKKIAPLLFTVLEENFKIHM